MSLSAILAELQALRAETEATRHEVRELRMIIMARADGPLASDAQLDDKSGDPPVRFDPRTWKGASCKGRKASECPPEYLDHLALALMGMAAKEDADRKMYKDRPASVYTRRRAALARGWALRLRLGWTPPEGTAEAPEGTAEAPETTSETSLGGPSPFSSEVAASPFAVGPSPFDNDAAEPPEEPAPPSPRPADEQEDDLAL